MRKLLLIVIGILIICNPSFAQEIDLYSSEKNAKVILSADAQTSGADASLILRRSDGLGKSVVRYDLQAIEDQFDLTIAEEESWDFGIRGGDNLKLYHFLSNKNLDGSFDNEVNIAMEVDHNTAREGKFEVAFPQGFLKIGGGTYIQEDDNQTAFKMKGGNELTSSAQGLEIDISADLKLSAALLTLDSRTIDFESNYVNFDFGDAAIQIQDYGIIPLEENISLGAPNGMWEHVFAESMSTYHFYNWWGSPSDAKSKSKKAVTSTVGLQSILNIRPIVRSDKKELALSISDLEKHAPNAIHILANPKGSKSQGEDPNLLAVEYDQLIPVLVKAIQEQQEMISAMQVQIDTLK